MTGPKAAAADGFAAEFPGILAPLLLGLYLLLTSTTQLIPGIWPYDAKRMLQFGLLLAVFFLPALSKNIRRELNVVVSAIPVWLGIALLLMIAWGVTSAVYNARSTMHALNSLSDVVLLTSLGLAVLVTAACRRASPFWFDRVAVGMVFLMALVVGFQELLGVAAALSGGVEFNFRVSLLHYSWPRFYNQVQSWTVPLLCALPVLFRANRLAAFLCAIALALQWYIIFMTGARGSFVALTAAFVFALLFIPQVRRVLLVWQLTGFVLGLALFGAVLLAFESADTESPATPEQKQLIRDADLTENGAKLEGGDSSFFHQSIGRPMVHTSGRTWMWSAALRDARRKPVLGIGPMNYACTSQIPYGHPHSFPLQLAAEWGIPAALTAISIFLVLIYTATRSIRSAAPGTGGESILAGLLLTCVLSASVHACLSGVIVMPASQVAGLLICGMLLGILPLRGRPAASYRSYWIIGLTGLLASLFLLALGKHELRTMESRAEQLPPGLSRYPRLWQDSKVCRFYIDDNQVRN